MATTQALIEQFHTKIAASSEESIAYAMSVACVALATFVDVLDMEIMANVVPGIFYTAVALLVYGFLRYLLPAVSSALNSMLAKAIWAGTFFVGTTFTLALSGGLVNDVLEVPASPFAYTRIIVAVLISPLVVAASSILLAVISMPLLLIISINGSSGLSFKSILLSLLNRTARTASEVVVMRFISLITIVALCATFLSSAGSYAYGVARFIKWFAYTFETEQFSYCDAKAMQRVAYLDRNVVIYAIASGDTFTFEIGKCEQDEL
jgi:hypothetical protein